MQHENKTEKGTGGLLERFVAIVLVLSVSACASTTASADGGFWQNFSTIFGSDAPPPQPQTQPGRPTFDENDALRLINDYGGARGVSPLTLDAQATAAASALAEDMAKKDKMSHYGPDGADVGKRLTSAGYAYRICAENVGVGQPTLKEIVDGWKKSPPHSKNMLLPAVKHMGLALAYNPNTKFKTFWTLVLASP